MMIGLNDGLCQKNSDKIKVEIGTGTAYTISQKKAEKALAKLSKTAENEDSWVYYKGQLIDDGKNENSETVTMHFPLIIKTDKGDTTRLQISSGDTIITYHNHIRPSPPSIYDIVNHSILIDSIFKNNHVISKVADNGKMWEFSLDDRLTRDLHGKNLKERFEILESKINIAYDPENKYKIGGYSPYPYHPKSSNKGYKEYISIMKEAGVIAKYTKPKALFHK